MNKKASLIKKYNKINLIKEVFFMFNFRTDLADERRDLYKKANKLDDNIEGIDV